MINGVRNMEFYYIIKKLAVFLLYSFFVGYVYVYVIGKRIGIEQNISNLIKVAIVAFLIFSTTNVLLPLIRGY